MIDKTQSAVGMRYETRAETGCADFVQGTDAKTTIAAVEARSDFHGWTTRLWQLGSHRDDYQVNDARELIRVGNQIDEDLYPAKGLGYVNRQHEILINTSLADHVRDAYGTVSKLMRYSAFFGWSDTRENRKLGLYVDEKAEEKAQKRGFKIGDRVRIVQGACYGGLSGVISLVGSQCRVELDNGKPACFFHTEMILISSDASTKEARLSKLEKAGKKLNNRKGLSSTQQKQMVHTQNKSLQERYPLETSYIRASLPDGVIIESPMPSAADGWVEIWSDKWQRGECMAAQGSGLDLYVADKWGNKETLALRGDQENWLRDMRTLLVNAISTDFGVCKAASILEVRKFTRPPLVQQERARYSDASVDLRLESAGEYDDSCWPAGAHARQVLFQGRGV